MLALFRKLSKAQRQTLWVCFFAFFVNGSMTLMLGSAMPDIKLAYGLTQTQGGMLLSGHSMGNLIAGFVSGLIPLWLGRKKSIVCLALGTALGFAMTTVFGNPVWLVIACIFTGIGRGSVTNFDNHMVIKVSNGSPAAANILHCFFAVGAFTAPMVFLWLSGMMGWRSGMLYVTALSVLAVIGFSRLHLDDNRPNRADKTQSTMVFMKNPSFLILVLMMFFYLCSEYAINGWLVTYLQHKESLLAAFSDPEGLIAYSQTMATILWVVILIGRLICALIAGKVGQKRLMLVASLGAMAFFGMLLMANSLALVTLSVMGVGLCMAGICPMIYSDAGIFTNTYPMATSTLLAFGSAGAILMPTIVGVTADAFGFLGGMSTVFATMTLLVVFAVLNVVVKTRVPVTKERQ